MYINIHLYPRRGFRREREEEKREEARRKWYVFPIRGKTSAKAFV